MDSSHVLGFTIVALSMMLSIYSLKSVRRLFVQQKATLSVITDDSPSKEIVWSGKEGTERLYNHMRFSQSPTMSKLDFLNWLRLTVSRKMKSDKEFINRVYLRNLRKQYKDLLYEVESAERHARKIFNATENAIRLETVEHFLRSSKQAVENMRKFVNINSENDNEYFIEDGKHTTSDISVSNENSLTTVSTILETSNSKTNNNNNNNNNDNNNQIRVDRVREMIPKKLLEIEQCTLELEILKNTTPEYHILQEAIQKLESCYNDIGLNEANKILKYSQHDSGRGRNERGFSFEDAAEKVLYDHLLPTLAKKENVSISKLLVVRNVKLGMASQKGSTAEIDCLICMKAPRPESMIANTASKYSEFCKVLAVVEVKRNADDIGDAFCGYQQSLSWLCGLQDQYNASTWVTKAYPRGHFDSNGENLMFTKESFEDLSRHEVSMSMPITTYSIENITNDKKIFIDKLYFVTRDARLECLHSKALNWILHQVASGEQFDDELSIDCENEIELLRTSVSERFAFRLNTVDVINLYMNCKLDEQLFVVGVDWRKNTAPNSMLS
eukprot:gene4756-9454_t